MSSPCVPRSNVRLAVFCGLLALALSGAAPALAQQQNTPAPELGSVLSPILTIDSDRLFLESAFGRRVAEEAAAKGTELATQNRQIEADLEAEEKAITVKRATLPADEFRALADAFDKKVQETRAAQTAKGRAINEELDQEREVFLEAAAPVLEKLMRDAGAAVILDRRSVFVSTSAVEITMDAIALLNETLGSGAE